MRKKDRQRIAIAMYETGKHTMEQIAEVLDVSARTISTDLEGFEAPSKPPRPKGGRPKGSGTKASKSKKSDAAAKPADKPRTETEQERTAAKLLAEGKTTKEIASVLGVGPRRAGFVIDAVNIRQSAEAQIDPTTLSQSAQEKLAAAIRQATRRLEAEIEQRVRAEVNDWLNNDLMPMYRKKEKHFNIIIANRAAQGVLIGQSWSSTCGSGS